MSSDESLVNTAIKEGSRLGLKFRPDKERAGLSDEGLFDRGWRAGEDAILLFVDKKYRSSQKPGELSSREMQDDAELEEESVEIFDGEVSGILNRVYKACYFPRDKTGYMVIYARDKDTKKIKCERNDADLHELESSVITAIYGRFG